MGWATLAREVLPVPRREGWPPEIAAHAPPLARYDAGWYRRIALSGYGRSVPSPGTPSEHVFFPLYPALVALAEVVLAFAAVTVPAGALVTAVPAGVAPEVAT